MKNKVVLITGATGGIGKATAMALAKQGAHIVLHGRDETKAQAAREEIVRATGNNQVDVLVADLFLLGEVRRMADLFKSRYTQLDVLINNAGGIMGTEFETTPEGHEKTMALNLFAPFLLTSLLLDVLQRSEDARIIHVSSSSHSLNAKPDFADMQRTKGYSPLRAYGNAKLFLILTTQYLAAGLRKNGRTNITVNAMHPGAVATNFAVDSNLGSFLNLFGKIARRFFKSPEAGADTLIYMASDAAMRGVSGQYYVDRKPARVNPKYNTVENERRVWDYCEKIVDVSTHI
jgi:NAD(P)-dependent dehydrogenase (short-subunit alcohol dehydrogenase family)